MERLYTTAWLLGVIAAFALLGAAYAYDVMGRRGLAGILIVIAVVTGRLAWQISKALRRKPKA